MNKIGPTAPPVTSSKAEGTSLERPKQPIKAPPVEASSQVELSSTANTLRSGSTSGEFDAEKVAKISAQIEAGTFKPNPGAIADKLVANAQEVLGKVGSA